MKKSLIFASLLSGSLALAGIGAATAQDLRLTGSGASFPFPIYSA